MGILSECDSIHTTRGLFSKTTGVIFAPTFTYKTLKGKANFDKILNTELEVNVSETYLANAQIWDVELDLNSTDRKTVEIGGNLNERLILAAENLFISGNLKFMD